MTSILLISFTLFAQKTENKIDKIIELTEYLSENENNRQIYNTIFTDGQINKKKYILGLFKKKIVVGGFAEKFVLKDSVLCKLWIGEREFLKDTIINSTNKVKTFIYDNENLCYYTETKIIERKDKTDTLLYKIEYFIDNENILKTNVDGEFKLDKNEYLKKVVEISKKKITEKNEMNNSLARTHAYVHWLADVHFAVFTPAFPLSFHDRKSARRPPNAHSLSR